MFMLTMEIHPNHIGKYVAVKSIGQIMPVFGGRLSSGKTSETPAFLEADCNLL